MDKDEIKQEDNSLKRIGEALIAFADKKRIQWKSLTTLGWTDWPPDQELAFFHNLAHDKYFRLRVKPEPKKRLIRADELPPVFWVRNREGWALCTYVSDKEGLRLAGSVSYVQIGEDAEKCGILGWSPDRKQVFSFWKED